MNKVTPDTILVAHSYPTAQLERWLDRGLPANRSLIYREYPQLPSALAQLSSKERKRFERKLSSAWIAQAERTKLSAYCASKVEKLVLRELGYSPCEDQRSVFRTILSLYKDHPYLPSVEALQTAVPYNIQELRLLRAGVEEKCLVQMQFLIDAMTAAKALLKKRSKEICAKKSLEAFPDWEFARKRYQGFLEDDNACSIHWRLSRCMKENKAKIQDILHRHGYESALKRMIKQDLIQPMASVLFNPSKDCDNRLQWLQKYRPALQGSELISEDPGEYLGRGVCFGQCFNVAMSDLKDARTPELPIAITRADRFVQALKNAHCARLRSNEQLTHLPKSFLRRYAHEHGELEEKGLWFVNKGPDQDAMIKKRLVASLLHKSKSVCVVSRRQHVTRMGFDQKRGIHYLFDPNLGTLHFTLEVGETCEQLAQRMAQAYIELYRTAYPVAEDGNELCYAIHWTRC